MYFYHLDKMVPAKITVTSLLLNLDVSIQSWPWHTRNSITLAQRLFCISCHYSLNPLLEFGSVSDISFTGSHSQLVTLFREVIETSSQNWVRGDNILWLHPGLSHMLWPLWTAINLCHHDEMKPWAKVSSFSLKLLVRHFVIVILNVLNTSRCYKPRE